MALRPILSPRLLAPALAALTLVGACGGDDGAASADAAPVGADADDGTGPLDPPPPANGQQLTTPEYSLEAGEEAYLCYTFDAPADAARAITKIETISEASVHHILFVKTMEREPAEPFSCPELIRLNWAPIYAVGAGAPGLTLPEGVGFPVAAGTQYLVQLHLQNIGDAAVTERAGLNLTYADDTAGTIPAGLYAMGSFALTIPGGATDHTQTIACDAEFPMNVFAIFPHMHKLGTKLAFRHGATESVATEKYAKDPWIFGDQPMDPLDLTVATGDFVESTCHWANPDGDPVGFGESSDAEMCFTLLFYYPAASDLSGCVTGI